MVSHGSWGPSTVHALCFGSPTSTWVVDLRLAWFLMDLGVVNRGACVVVGNNGGLRGLSWILESVNRACVVRGPSTGTGVVGLSWEQPRLAWGRQPWGLRGLGAQRRLAWSLMDLGVRQ